MGPDQPLGPAGGRSDTQLSSRARGQGGGAFEQGSAEGVHALEGERGSLELSLPGQP